MQFGDGLVLITQLCTVIAALTNSALSCIEAIVVPLGHLTVATLSWIMTHSCLQVSLAFH